MTDLRECVRGFRADEAGAITIDWVALTSGVLLLGIAVVYAIFNSGVTPLTNTVNGQLKTAGVGLEVGETPFQHDYPFTFDKGMMIRDWERDILAVRDTDGNISRYTLSETSGWLPGQPTYLADGTEIATYPVIADYNVKNGSYDVYDWSSGSPELIGGNGFEPSPEMQAVIDGKSGT